MPRSFNQVILIGHLGRDAETKYTQGGVSVTSFSIATERRFKRGEEWVSEADWHNITAWRVENLAPYLTKGKAVFIAGRLQTRSYEDKDGKKVWKTDVVAETVNLLGGGEDRGGDGGERTSKPAPVKHGHDRIPADQGVSDEDVPF